MRRLLQKAEQENDFFVWLETMRFTEGEAYSYLFSNPIKKINFFAGDSITNFFNQITLALENGAYVAGYFTYEFGYIFEPQLLRSTLEKEPLATLGIFTPPIVYKHTDIVAEHFDVLTQPTIQRLRTSITKEAYIKNVYRLKKAIIRGDTYQVNYTFKILFEYKAAAHDLYVYLRNKQRVGYGAYIKNGNKNIASFSPELFFKKEKNKITTRPMKGTIHRGRTTAEDAALKKQLQTDEKNKSENVMIVDLLRNDLSRLCEIGSVSASSLFDVNTFETIQQMTSTIEGELRKDITLYQLFQALYPCGSITGAPKIKTIDFIQQIEQEQRGVYTGAIGYFAPDGAIKMSVPIRTVVLENRKGEMGVGSGIIHRAKPSEEWHECLLKSKFLTSTAANFSLVETLLWQHDSGYLFLDEHLARLKDSGQYFQYPINVKSVRDALFVYEKINFKNASFKRVRLLVNKNGTVTIFDNDCETPSLYSFPSDDENLEIPLPKISIAKKRTNAASPFLYHKTTQRELYDLTYATAVANNFCETIFKNEMGAITEGCVTNIFIKKNGCILTPSLDNGLLNGILRQHLLKHATIAIKETVLKTEDLLSADAIYVGNSVRGLQRVRLVC